MHGVESVTSVVSFSNCRNRSVTNYSISILGGFIFDRSGTYTAAVVFCMVAVVMATGCIWAAAPRRGNEEALV